MTKGETTLPDPFDLPIRIVVESPYSGLDLALQRGQAASATLVQRVTAPVEDVAFDLTVTVAGRLADGRPRLLGPFVQGPPAARFVYLCVGCYAGQADTTLGGRIKVPLGGLDGPLLAPRSPDRPLTARICGTSAKDGPVLATVKLGPPGWV